MERFYDFLHLNRELQEFLNNLEKKQAILDALSKLLDSEEDMEKFKVAIEEHLNEWKQVGDVPKKNSNIQNHFNTLLKKCYEKSGIKKSDVEKIMYANKLQLIEGDQNAINSDAMRILIRDPKGKKDRVVPLPRKLLHNLRLYYRAYRPKKFLFEGQTGGVYSVKSIQNFIKKYASNAQLTKRVFPHILRHSYATHQLENGVNIRYVQTLLGHKSIKTTELYTHVAEISKGNILSPLDQL